MALIWHSLNRTPSIPTPDLLAPEHRLEKLVRDKIPSIIASSGTVKSVRKADKAELISWLTRKLIEESSELAETPCIEECADVYEVFLNILVELNLSIANVESAACRKRLERGGFQEGYILETE